MTLSVHVVITTAIVLTRIRAKNREILAEGHRYICIHVQVRVGFDPVLSESVFHST